jgi:predicted dehydrogenase
MRYARTRPDGAEVWEDFLYNRRAYFFNNEVHGMHYGEFANYAEHFAAALLEQRPNAPDLEEGIETFCVMEAIRRSAQIGQPVPLAPILAEVGL